MEDGGVVGFRFKEWWVPPVQGRCLGLLWKSWDIIVDFGISLTQ